MNIIEFGFSGDDDSERHIVVNHIHSSWIRPISYESATDKPNGWAVGIDMGHISHNINYYNYDEAITKYEEIVNSMIECKK